MNIDVFITPDRVTDDMLRGRSAAVIDVLRASTTIAAALAGGCREVLPQESMDDAAALARRLDRDRVLLCGERGGEKIAGYDLGNSPREYTAGTVGGRFIIFTSTNGSRAMVRSGKSLFSTVVSFLNITAAAVRLAEAANDLVIVCSGRENQFSLEDTVCAGLLADKIDRLTGGAGMNDAARMARILSARYEDDIEGMLRESDHGRYLESIGFGDDLPVCARVDSLADVPVYRDGRITLA